MSENKDGGPAFPLWENAFNSLPGLTKREWFAGMALSSKSWNTGDKKATAKDCYEMADAMIQEAEKE